MKQFIMMILSSSLLLLSGNMMNQDVFGQTNDTMKFNIVVGTPPPREQNLFSGGGVEIAIADAAAREGDGTMSFSVSLSQASEQAVSFTYQLSDGTATAGSDYTAYSSMMSLPPGKTSAEIVVSLLDDGFHEEEETFTIRLSAVSGAAEGKLSAIGTIKDDDALPSLTIGEATASENSQKMVFTVKLNHSGSEPVTVDYETQDTGGEQHAIAGSDYTAASGTITMSPGSTSATIEVAITKDANNDEGDEFFHLVLRNPVNATIVTAQATGTIQNGAGHAGGGPGGGGDGSAVPEPSTIGLFVIGLLGLGLAAKRRRN